MEAELIEKAAPSSPVVGGDGSILVRIDTCNGSTIGTPVRRRIVIPAEEPTANGFDLPNPPSSAGANYSRRRAQRFFAELDVETHPSMAAESVRVWSGAFGAFLLEQFRAVARGETQPVVTREARHYAHELAKIYLRLAARHFAEGEQLDLGALDTAFEEFAGGLLRLPVAGVGYCVQPSSGAYFLFAEWAFTMLRIDDGASRPLWLEFARTFVRTQEIYVARYPAAAGSPARLDRFHHCRFGHGRTLDLVERDALRETYRGYRFEDLARRRSELAAAHFAGF